MRRSLFVLVIILLACLAVGGLEVGMTIPVKNKDIYESDRLVAGVTWHERARVTLTNNGETPLRDVRVSVDVPSGMDVEVPGQETETWVEGGRVKAVIDVLGPGDSSSFVFSVKPPESVEFRKSVSFRVNVSYSDGGGVRRESYIHEVEVVPPPSWVTYGSLVASFLIVLVVFLVSRRLRLLEWFTTIDLVTLALLAALIGVVFRWFWQTFNDLLGPLGGLLFTIPTTVVLIVALQLVRKPGTATLLFTVVELVAMVVWGTNVTLWLGWYMGEGVIVDVLVMLFRDYGDKRGTSIIYGVVRGGFSYWTFYFLFAPAVWKVYYAPWYAWSEVGIAALGGVIGGYIGYDIARKMRKATI